MRRSTRWTLIGAGCVLALIGAPAQQAHAAITRASCYGPSLYGNRTANGTVLTTRTEGIAHKTLPLGTPVVLFAGRRAAFARVVDRGPFIRGRDVDVTSATARRLGFRNCKSFGVRRIYLWTLGGSR